MKHNPVHRDCLVHWLGLLSASWRWQTQWVPCQQESASSTACLLSDHSLGHLWLPHTRETAESFLPVVLQLWVSGSATVNRVFMSIWYPAKYLTSGCLLWMCFLTFLVSRRLISLTSACLSAWFLAEKRKKERKQNNNRTLIRCCVKARLDLHQSSSKSSFQN